MAGCIRDRDHTLSPAAATSVRLLILAPLVAVVGLGCSGDKLGRFKTLPDAGQPVTLDAGAWDAGAPDAGPPPWAEWHGPPMGWNSWNKFNCNIDATLIEDQAEAMVNSGMAAAGYRYVNIDDCWQVSRDTSGQIVADAAAFPQGIKAVADVVHAKGLKLGIYTDAGSQTCQLKPGSLGHEVQDAQTYAAWGLDFVKEDWCNTDGLSARSQYPRMQQALKATGRDIVLSICEWGSQSPWLWAPGVGTMWRTTPDIADTWASMLGNLDQSAEHAAIAGAAGFNDPDMLEIGNGGMTPLEDRTQMTMWAISAAPLIAGNDLRLMSARTLETLTNLEVIAVDQDEAFVQGVQVNDDDGALQVWSKPLKDDGARAVALLNRSGADAMISFTLAEIGLGPGAARMRDLWAHQDLGVMTAFQAQVPAHGATLLRVEGQELPPPPAGTSYVSDLPWTYAASDWGMPERDRSNNEYPSHDGRAIRLNGTAYPKGVGMHAQALLRLRLGGRCTRFHAVTGVDDESASLGYMKFQVLADGKLLFDGNSTRGGQAAQVVDVDVTGAQELRLVEIGLGETIDSDHGDWADAKVTCGP
jgi:alpha-galactosidase